MSKIALEGNASGTGTFTLASPNSSTDRTLTLPDAAGTVATQEYIPTALNATGSAPIYACRAWVNFNGTGTVAIRASGNVSSITDGGTGIYTVNFTTAMPDADYSPIGTPGANRFLPIDTRTTTSARVLVINDGGGFSDISEIYVAIFR